jgi:hypothetical protein
MKEMGLMITCGEVRIPPETAELARRRLDRRTRKTDGCWLWTGAVLKDGYGTVMVLGRSYRTHRLSAALAFGVVPANTLVCHHCDVRACVRPEHLFLGSNADNMRDAIAKGRLNLRDERRHVFGSRHGFAKLNEAKVLEARTRRALGEKIASIARSYGVAVSTMKDALSGRKWKHV